MKKVSLTESEIRKVIRAALMEADPDPPAAADAGQPPSIFSPINPTDFNELEQLKTFYEKLSPVEVGGHQYTGNVYEEFINVASSQLGVPAPKLPDFNSSSPQAAKQSQFEILQAYYKLAIIAYLQMQDVSAGPLSVEGSKADTIVPFIVVENVFYTCKTGDPKATTLLNDLKSKLGITQQQVYTDQAFYDKLSDPAFITALNRAPVKVSDKSPEKAFIDTLTDKDKEAIAAEATKVLNDSNGKLNKTWNRLHTALYDAYFLLPVNSPNIWQIINKDENSPLYNPWRETWVVCNLINKALALPAGAAALAALLQKASQSGLTAEKALRPTETDISALSPEPLAESRLIIASDEQLRTLIRAALNEFNVGISSKQSIDEGFWSSAGELAKDTGRSILRLFRGEDPEVIKAIQADLLGTEFKSSLRNVDTVKAAVDSAPLLADPGALKDILGRDCIADLRQALGVDTAPKLAEATRQILNLSFLYAEAFSKSNMAASAEYANKLYKICTEDLNGTERAAVQKIIDAAKDDAGTGALAEAQRISKHFMTNPALSLKMATEGASGAISGIAKSGVIRDLLSGETKYSKDQPGLLSKSLNALWAIDRYAVAPFTGEIADAAAKRLPPSLRDAAMWLKGNKLVRGALAKMLFSYLLTKVLFAEGVSGEQYQDNFYIFALERIADPNPLSFSTAEIILGALGDRNISPQQDLDSDYMNALCADPSDIEAVLVGAVNFLKNGIKIPDGSFPTLQTPSTSRPAAGLNWLDRVAKLINFTGEQRRQAVIQATEEAQKATEVISSASAEEAVRVPDAAFKNLEEQRKATADDTVTNISISLTMGGYTYKQPPNGQTLKQSYPKTRPEGSFSLLSAWAGARDANEVNLLIWVTDRGNAIKPSVSINTILGKEEDEPLTQEEQALEDALTKLSSAINAANAPTPAQSSATK